jgi:hypothetical protein
LSGGDIAYPISIAPGIAGAVLELVYTDSMDNLVHTRLMDETSWTWTTPASVGATGHFGLVSIASRP